MRDLLVHRLRKRLHREHQGRAAQRDGGAEDAEAVRRVGGDPVCGAEQLRGVVRDEDHGAAAGVHGLGGALGLRAVAARDVLGEDVDHVVEAVQLVVPQHEGELGGGLAPVGHGGDVVGRGGQRARVQGRLGQGKEEEVEHGGDGRADGRGQIGRQRRRRPGGGVRGCSRVVLASRVEPPRLLVAAVAAAAVAGRDGEGRLVALVVRVVEAARAEHARVVEGARPLRGQSEIGATGQGTGPLTCTSTRPRRA
ncbi:hypothetical protein DFJ74DRAFT_325645 [Hyaloraphidium curvatum]|nr:hypothetical protein DFJ74DRAFT_325645 [Hyaloraphidium curvatum]